MASDLSDAVVDDFRDGTFNPSMFGAGVRLAETAEGGFVTCNGFSNGIMISGMCEEGVCVCVYRNYLSPPPPHLPSPPSPLSPSSSSLPAVTMESSLQAEVDGNPVDVSSPTTELLVSEGASLQLTCSGENTDIVVNNISMATFQTQNLTREDNGFYQCITADGENSLYLLVTCELREINK